MGGQMSENILKNAIQADTNIWINASAGSGKTYVLIRRILKLLLNKNNPNKILCITFTNAATFEMKQRLQNILYNWKSDDLQTVKKDLLK